MRTKDIPTATDATNNLELREGLGENGSGIQHSVPTLVFSPSFPSTHPVSVTSYVCGAPRQSLVLNPALLTVVPEQVVLMYNPLRLGFGAQSSTSVSVTNVPLHSFNL